MKNGLDSTKIFLKKDLYLAEIVSLASTIGIEVTVESLQAKLAECSRHKDELFQVKAAKMREIGNQISHYDIRINERRNFTDNKLKASLKEARNTLAQTETKISDIDIAHTAL